MCSPFSPLKSTFHVSTWIVVVPHLKTSYFSRAITILYIVKRTIWPHGHLYKLLPMQWPNSDLGNAPSIANSSNLFSTVRHPLTPSFPLLMKTSSLSAPTAADFELSVLSFDDMGSCVSFASSCRNVVAASNDLKDDIGAGFFNSFRPAFVFRPAPWSFLLMQASSLMSNHFSSWPIMPVSVCILEADCCSPATDDLGDLREYLPLLSAFCVLYIISQALFILSPVQHKKENIALKLESTWDQTSHEEHFVGCQKSKKVVVSLDHGVLIY